MAGEQISNSVRAGAFVLTCMALGFAVIFSLMRTNLFVKRDAYQIRFTLKDGVAGLAPGSDVQIGGLSRGTVRKVTPDIVKATGDVKDILVEIEIDADIQLFHRTNTGPLEADDGVQVIRVASPLGNTATINFISVGIPNVKDGRVTNQIEPNQEILASGGSGLLASLVGAENALRVGDILGNTANFTRTLDERAGPILENAQQIVEEVAKDYDTWREHITNSLRNADQSLVRINGYLAPEGKVDVFLDEAVSFAGAAKDVMVEARDTAMPKIETILDYGLTSVISLDTLLAQAQAELTAEIPTIRSFLFNAREAATQLKLGTLEVRRNPWRLLNMPGPKEIANENLYQAAADFAVATSELNVASEALRAVLSDQRNRFAQDPAFRALIEQQVLSAVDRFEKSRNELGIILNAAPRSPAGAP